MIEWVVLSSLAALGWFWFDSARAREVAVAASARLCASEGVQFLDDTVSIRALGVGRNRAGRLALRRSYRFEFSDTGDNRRSGGAVVLGAELESLFLEPYGATWAP